MCCCRTRTDKSAEISCLLYPIVESHNFRSDKRSRSALINHHKHRVRERERERATPSLCLNWKFCLRLCSAPHKYSGRGSGNELQGRLRGWERAWEALHLHWKLVQNGFETVQYHLGLLNSKGHARCLCLCPPLRPHRRLGSCSIRFHGINYSSVHIWIHFCGKSDSKDIKLMLTYLNIFK